MSGGGRLGEKVAIITGGSRGIGKAMAEAFAREGGKVVIASRKMPGLQAAADEINGKGYAGEVMPWACHVGDAEQVGELVSRAEEEFGPVNVLVNNAGTNPYFGPMLGTQMPAWDKTFEVNLKGPFVATQLVAQRLMEEGSGGSVINVSSILGMGAAPLQGVYGMTKAAIISRSFSGS